MTMHPKFPVWYKRVEPQADAAMLAKRWAACVAVADVDTVENVILLLTVCCIPTIAAHTQSALTEAIAKSDDSFPLEENADALRVMAASAIVSKLQNPEPSNVADALARGIQLATFPDLKMEIKVSDLVRISREYLTREADSVRPDDFDDQLKSDETLKARIQAIAAAADVKAVATATQQAFDSLRSLQKKWSESITDRLLRLSEETQLAWWTMGAYSNILSRPFSECTVNELALVSAREVSDRTKFVPAPDSIRHVLSTGLRHAKGDAETKTDFKSLVEASVKILPQNSDQFSKDGIARFLPISTALEKAAEMEDAAFWTKSLEKACPPISSGTMISPLNASWQFFQELEFRRALNLL